MFIQFSTAGYHNNFEQLGNILAALDVFISFATVSANAPIPYTRPILHPRGTGILSFEQLRHPCVESQAGVNFIPNDIRFEQGRSLIFTFMYVTLSMDYWLICKLTKFYSIYYQ